MLAEQPVLLARPGLDVDVSEIMRDRSEKLAAGRGDHPDRRRRSRGELTADEEEQIRDRARSGESRKSLRRRFGTSNFVIYDVIGELDR